MFEITKGRGFKLTFPNGLTLSTQIGADTYSDNHGDLNVRPQGTAWPISSTAEIAILDPKGELITSTFLPDAELVQGYVTIEEWLNLIEQIKNYQI